jgi:chromosome partitioning protein
MRLVVGTLKGGVGKTTTALYLGAGLARTGRTLLVDADPQARTLMDWRGVAGDEWPEHVTVTSHVEPRSLSRDIGGMARDYEHVVVDVGGESDLLLAAALAAADHLVCPVTPSPPELRRLPATIDLAERAAIGAGREITARVLLVKVERRSVALREARELLAAEGVPVMDADVRYLPAAIPNTFGTLPVDLVDYGPVLAELTADVAVPA